jgi:O-antigen/teichoic acid export membrane protein
MTGVMRKSLRFFVGDAAARAVVFVVVVTAARRLGPSEFGRFAFVYGVVAIALLVGDLGLTPLIMRRLSRRSQFHPNAFWSAVATNLFIGAIAYVGLLAVFAATFPRDELLMAIYGPVLLIQALATSVDAALFSFERGPRIALVRLGGNLVLGLAAIVVLLSRPSAEGIAAAFVVGGAVKLTLGLVAARSILRPARIRPRLALAMLRYSLPFAAAAILSFLYFRVDIVLLGVISSNRNVGQYAAAYRIIDGVLLFPAALSYTSFPRWTSGQASFSQLSRMLRGLLCASLLVGLALGLWGGQLIRVVYGGSFDPAASALRILAAAVPVLFLDVIAVWLAYARRRERDVVWIGGLALIANLALNFALIPRFGIRGAAFATVASEVVNAFGYAYLFRTALRRHARALALEGARVATAVALIGIVFGMIHEGYLPQLIGGAALLIAIPGVFMLGASTTLLGSRAATETSHS